jgi:hypothetical protein
VPNIAEYESAKSRLTEVKRKHKIAAATHASLEVSMEGKRRQIAQERQECRQLGGIAAALESELQEYQERANLCRISVRVYR